MTANGSSAAARAPNRVDFVDEDDRRRDLPRLGKEFAHPPRTDADDHFDKLRGARAEERNLRFARGGTCEQCLTRTRGAREQNAFRSTSAHPSIFLRIFQEVDNLIDLRFHFVDAGDIVERDANGFWIDAFLPATT